MTTLFVRPDRPVDPLTVAVLREIDSLARELHLSYFVAGAMARDIVLTNVFGIETGRATRDVDFGIALANWGQFDLVKSRLVGTGRFVASDRVAQRVYYGAPHNKTSYPVDVIPFGGLEAPHLLSGAPQGITVPPGRFDRTAIRSCAQISHAA